MEATIAAISTAYGEGGIGIIRISGEKAKPILDRIFVSPHKIENRKLTYGKVVDPKSGEDIDEVLAVFMEGPNTYTCEDVVEINCHGSVVSLRKTLSLCFEEGAIPAEKGEFTKRAFLNGRLDLSQAEAVIDLIKAKADKTFEVALGQLEGRLSAEIKEIRALILDILVNIAVNIDYPDEDIEEVVYRDLERDLSVINHRIGKLIASANTGKLIKEGLNVAIIGKPNVGKSSLMNALLKEARAIVTEIPGTTRDTIEETLTLKNIPIKLTDTAGIRSTEDQIEKIGIEKSKESFNRADLIIFIVDVSRELEDEDLEIIKYIGEKKLIVLANKQDLGAKITKDQLKKMLPGGEIIETSMKEYAGLEAIEDKIEELVYAGEVKQDESLLVSNVRHENLLKDAFSSIEDGKMMILAGEALEFIEIDIKKAFELLGEIIGETVSEDIIDEVFSRFCLGK
ncbi:MAG: tRNA uridine-5-carboxymethylaminomethyl(34) synthesis GTPase MnmE [Anaerovoracaceae bacterium]